MNRKVAIPLFVAASLRSVLARSEHAFLAPNGPIATSQQTPIDPPQQELVEATRAKLGLLGYMENVMSAVDLYFIMIVICLIVLHNWYTQRPPVKYPASKAKAKDLRFSLQDRVMCKLRDRWIGGVIVGKPEEKDDWCYLVRPDPHHGLESGTISVPEDTEDVCVQEVCFCPDEMKFIKGAAQQLSDNPSFRFMVGARVSCRVRDKGDWLENWQAGEVMSTNFELPVMLERIQGDIKRRYAASVPYMVKLDSGGKVLCHSDNYTLIRREGLEPQTRVKGVSKRMEDRREPSGALVRFDHMTERKKVLVDDDDDDDDDDDVVVELTDEQKKALFIE